MKFNYFMSKYKNKIYFFLKKSNESNTNTIIKGFVLHINSSFKYQTLFLIELKFLLNVLYLLITSVKSSI